MTEWSSTAVCREAGLTYRQLDWWTRSGAITPSIVEGEGSGSYRVWSSLDVACLRAIAEVTRDLAAVGIPDVSTDFIGRLWARLRERSEVVLCEGTLTISLARPLVGGR